MSSTNDTTEKHSHYSEEEQQRMLEVAGRSIDCGLEHQHALSVDPGDYPENLRKQRATFVTLTIGGQLRGCIGVLEAHHPLIVDIANNAYSAAFSDHRFPPLSRVERGRLEVKISILTPPESLECDSEADLLGKMRPYRDGLILEDGACRGTFLPAVWGSLPNPSDFLHHLKQKAGLSPDYWSDSIKIKRYEAIEIG